MTTVKLLPGLVLMLFLAVVRVTGMQPPGGAATDGFVPLDSLPPGEQLPAAPLLITAYAFVWVLLMAYLWSIAKRLRKVESEMETLRRRTPGATGR